MERLIKHADICAAIREVLNDPTRSRWLLITDVSLAFPALSFLAIEASHRGEPMKCGTFQFSNAPTAYRKEVQFVILQKSTEYADIVRCFLNAGYALPDEGLQDIIVASEGLEIPYLLRAIQRGELSDGPLEIDQN